LRPENSSVPHNPPRQPRNKAIRLRTSPVSATGEANKVPGPIRDRLTDGIRDRLTGTIRIACYQQSKYWYSSILGGSLTDYSQQEDFNSKAAYVNCPPKDARRDEERKEISGTFRALTAAAVANKERNWQDQHQLEGSVADEGPIHRYAQGPVALMKKPSLLFGIQEGWHKVTWATYGPRSFFKIMYAVRMMVDKRKTETGLSVTGISPTTRPLPVFQCHRRMREH